MRKKQGDESVTGKCNVCNQDGVKVWKGVCAGCIDNVKLSDVKAGKYE